MKIIAIRGKNIASLEGEFSIDFTSQPLASAGIFAISGPTGSGKSTLLDTMCLALFGRTPRTDQAKENEIRLLDVKDSMLRQGDPRGLLRRGTASGYAETDFVALNGVCYRSRWSVRRSRDKESGALQDFRLTLINLDTDKEEQGGKKELQTRISELIGLTFEQFTRSVLLAQNDFSTFLKADQSDKAALLEKLTGTELYSGISRLIYDKNSVAKEAYEQLYARIKGIELLSDDEVVQLSIQQTQLDTALLALKEEKKAVERKQKWFFDLAVLQDGIKQATQEVASAMQAWKESQPRYAYLRLVDKVHDARSLYDAVKTTERSLQEKQIRRQQTAVQLEQIKQQHEKISLGYESALKEQRLAEEQYASLTPELNEARKLDVQLDEAQRTSAATESRLKQASDERIAGEERLLQLTNRLTALIATIDTLHQWKEQHLAKESVAEQCDILLLQLNTAEKSQQQIETSTRNIRLWNQSIQKDEEQQRSFTETLQVRKEEQIKQEEARVALEKLQSETDYDLLRVEIEQYRAKREQYGYDQALLLSQNMIALREKLSDGSPCPLCGSAHHPYASADVRLQESFSVVLEAVDTKLKELSALETTYHSRQKELSVLYDRQLALHKTINDFENKISSIESSLVLVKSKIVREQEALQEQTSILQAVLDSANKLFAGDQWQQAWLNNPEVFREKLKEFTAQWKRNNELLREKEAEHESARVELASFKNIFPTLQKREEEVLKEYNDGREQVVSLKKRRNVLLDGCPVLVVEQNFSVLLEAKKQQVLNLFTAQNEITQTYEQAKGTAIQVAIDILSLQKAFDVAEKALGEWLTGFNQSADSPLSIDELSALLTRNTQWIESERDFLSRIQTHRVTAETTLRERDGKLHEHEKLQSGLQVDQDCSAEILQQELLIVEENLKQQTALLNECLFRLRRNTENKERIKSFDAELNARQQVSERWAKLNELAGSADGGKFRRIAQGYTLDILLNYANVQLRELTRRYRLERVPETLALQVIDRDMCDEVRTVHSLSGGESFLVSLALALGLSSLSSNRMKVESLFIDEGFGSLDADTLRIAMDALESLRTQGRKIGVISHVQEMTERIPVQIKVEREGNGRSRLAVIG